MSAVMPDATEAVIARLSRDLAPAPRMAVGRRLAFGLGAGAAVSAVLLAASLGFRADMAQAMGAMSFWLKLVYTLALAGLAVWACERLARPGVGAGRRLAWLAAPVALVLALAAWEMAGAPPDRRMPMLMGHSAHTCPFVILAVSLPPLAGLVWAVRGLAPTRLVLTGLATGLAAGGAGAAIYALCCNETTTAFLAVWFTLGVAGAGLVGALLGPRLLRW